METKQANKNEKRKNSRPTVTQVRMLTDEIERLRNEYAQLRREKENADMIHESIVEESAKMSKELTELRKQVRASEDVRKMKALEQSNVALEEELERQRKENADLEYRLYKVSSEKELLKNRGFFARLLNR